MKLTYQDKVIDFPVIESIEQIKKEFEISDTKTYSRLTNRVNLLALNQILSKR